MSYIALTNNDIFDNVDEFVKSGKGVFIGPRPKLNLSDYPAIWFDIHLASTGYEICGQDKFHKFVVSKAGTIVKIRPGQSLRFSTLERIGIKNDTTALVVNCASMAIRGLFIAPGKIDPGFGANRLTIVVTNLSKRSIDLKAGEKVASIAFASASNACVQTKSTGWADKKIQGYSDTFWARIVDAIKEANYVSVLEKGIIPLLAAILALLLRSCFMAQQ